MARNGLAWAKGGQGPRRRAPRKPRKPRLDPTTTLGCVVNDEFCAIVATATCDRCRNAVCGRCAVMTTDRRLLCHVCADRVGEGTQVEQHLVSLRARFPKLKVKVPKPQRILLPRWSNPEPRNERAVEPPHISTRGTSRAHAGNMDGKENLS